MPNDRGFTGQRNERGFGLMDYNARYYSTLTLMFVSPDTIIPDPYSPMDWNRYLYVRSNPVNATDPTGHAMKLDDEGGNNDECPANTCYIVSVGSTPGLPYYPTSPETYGQNAEETYTWGEVMPDVSSPRITIKNPSFVEPSALAGALSYASDLWILARNRKVEHEPSRITIFAFYKMESGGIGVKSLDVVNPTGADISIMGVSFISNQSGYSVKRTGDWIVPKDGFFGIGPVAQPNSTTSVSLIPSGDDINPANIFPGRGIRIIIQLAHTGTGMKYKWIQGVIE